MARLATGQPMFPVALGVQAGILEGALGASKGETAIPWSVFVVCEYLAIGCNVARQEV